MVDDWQFLCASDAGRALRTFQKLARHDIGGWALTGGIAIEIHLLRLGCQPSVRALNDIDFIADGFDCIPDSLADDFLFRHIHPLETPGRNMLQLIDPDSVVRVDVFRACGAAVSRTSRVEIRGGVFVQLVSLEDLTARSARLALDLAEGRPTPSKYARDFPRLVNFVAGAEMEAAWRDHRKPAHPATFDEANRLLQDLIAARADLSIAVDYSKDTEAVCPRCAPTAAFRLADPRLVLSLLGYC